MKALPWEPKVKNKYSLTIDDIEKLKVGNLDLVKPPLFWWNNVISAWCISGCTIKSENTYWIGIYPIVGWQQKVKFKFYFTCYADQCMYEFTEFYNPEEIENKYDLMIQEMFLEKINELIDKGILIKA